VSAGARSVEVLDHFNPQAGAARPVPRCMEVWGSSREREESIRLAGMQVWLHAQPFAEQGGDVLFISSCGHGHVYRFAIADVAGHGNAVATFAEELRALMRAHVDESDQTDFARSLNHDWLSAQRSGPFATALFVTCLLPERRVVVCNAGHPKPLWYRAERREWVFLDERHGIGDVDNLPIGIIEPTNYAQFAVVAGERDLLVLYTDAYLETRHHGVPLGEQGLMRLVRGLDAQSAATLGRDLRDALAATADSIDDDRTLLVVAPRGAER
jgi:phosphoserine phosphatase RsbU/P